MRRSLAFVVASTLALSACGGPDEIDGAPEAAAAIAGELRNCKPPTSSLCGKECVDLASDRANCGACGMVCPVRTACYGGICYRPPPYNYCGEGIICIPGR